MKNNKTAILLTTLLSIPYVAQGELVKPGTNDFLQVARNLPNLLAKINNLLAQTILLGDSLNNAENKMLVNINNMDKIDQTTGIPFGLGTTLTTNDLKKIQEGLEALAAAFPIANYLLDQQNGLLSALAQLIDDIGEYLIVAVNQDASEQAKNAATKLREINQQASPLVKNVETILPRIQKMVAALNKMSDALAKLLGPKK